MKEAIFYEMCEKLEGASLPSGMGDYYPTVEELKISLQGRTIEELMPVLLFYASDPFKDKITAPAYRDVVKYAKELTSRVDLE